ncbi:hypothetical protein NBRC116602_29030 [Hyphomicrobiales bacterium 4NK60-0047b]
MLNLKSLIIAFVIGLVSLNSASAAHHEAGKWVLSSDESKVAYGSIKKSKVGEINHFTELKGNVATDGAVNVSIDLGSVETWIDIRNERMVKFVFDEAKVAATLKTKINPEEINKLKPGGTTTVTVKGTLSFLGKDIPIEADMFVAKLTDKKIMVTTDEMIMLAMEDAGINDKITKLMELAKLPAITRAAPVTLRFVFVKE